MKPNMKLMMAAGLLVLSAGVANAFPAPQPTQSSGATLVAQGCGYGAWRGPWGHCRDTPYYGPTPGGGYKVAPAGNGCPGGYWRGPWGHCRDTIYHGPLPGGGWK
ncbi:GCG_CRPN prefix-to-repeats domain-containing protein [Roseixanthobacter psychrophilus]|uniref:GCG_CRPN prefix-to-repeats domain-containing protein n=1 Tax=Roseixanthobacter psychrophilus TaxID=3119917 RepID=UPI003D2340E7